MMTVTLFARIDLKLNPYIRLFQKALQSQGMTVILEREFGLSWLMHKGRSCDVIHLHWLEAAYSVDEQKIRSPLLRQMIEIRYLAFILGALRLLDFSLALLWAKLQRKHIVYTIHNLTRFHGQGFWLSVILNHTAHRIVLSLANKIHVHSRYVKEQVATMYGAKNKVTVIPHGNYIGCYPNQISRADARAELGLPQDAFVFLSLGLLRPYKGLEILIEAFENLAWPAGRLLIAGRAFQADYETKLVHLTQDCPTIKLVPEFIADEDLQLYLNACDIFVLPYKDVTTSGAALLAFSFGRPIIAPSIASFPELVTSNLGLLYDPAVSDGLLGALKQATRRTWSEEEILDYAHQFDWQTLAPRLFALYQDKTDIHSPATTTLEKVE